jgi:hypothetical protein
LKKIILVLIVMGCFWGVVESENNCAIMYPEESGDWGIGICWLPVNTEIPVYTEPGGKKIGTIRRFLDKDDFHCEFIDKKYAIENTGNDRVWVGNYFLPVLKVFKNKQNRYFNVLQNGLKGGLWIDKADIDKSGRKYFSYHSVLLGKKEDLPEELKDMIMSSDIGVNLAGSCLNLRSRASSDSSIIKCIPPNIFSSSENPNRGYKKIEIKNYQGNWALVDAIYYMPDPEHDESGEGCVFKEISRTSGWIKVIDESGFPNIWFSVTSY